MRIVKATMVIAALLAFAGTPEGRAVEPDQENWKGTPYPTNFGVGVMGGIGQLGGNVGFSLPFLASAKILHQGFIPDINDQVHLEVQGGPLVLRAGTGFTYSVHLRWDFHKDYLLSLYALGGFGGMFSGTSLGNARRFHPRVGLGAFYHLFEQVSFRGEFSHEFVGLGVQVSL